ncbi:hypothetical protein M6B38_327175 [Iris pallida]|uniref:Uncharacterized protein n=1 Tax=Iris pallida TaxID=29817 RepID=A0AAX6H6H9_IRIPA|nr:hypothetical protein M6B38_327175 [Iris pallida]
MVRGSLLRTFFSLTLSLVISGCRSKIEGSRDHRARLAAPDHSNGVWLILQKTGDAIY